VEEVGLGIGGGKERGQANLKISPFGFQTIMWVVTLM
jgi:hypothetical protein